MRAQGLGITAIATRLGLARHTVRKYYRADALEDAVVRGLEGAPSVLDRHKPYLAQRFAAGITRADLLFQEVRERGYPGSERTVRRHVATLRAQSPAPPAPPPPPPKVRDVARWILTNPDRLDSADAATLDLICVRSPTLAALRGHVAAFAEMLTGRHGERLDSWLAAVETDDQPELWRVGSLP